MDFNAFLSELIKKEMDLIGKDKVLPFLAKCGIQTDAAGKVTAVSSEDKVGITQKLVAELCTVNALAKVPARAVCMVYRKFDPNFAVKF